MTPESSPFSPGQPVPLEYFVGRSAEIERLRSMVRASTQGKFKIGFVSGERGIGKSSLVSFVRHLSERVDRVVGSHVFLGGVHNLHEMVRRTFDRILKESIEKPWHTKVMEFFGDRVKEVGLFGVSLELNLSATELSTITHDFVLSIRRLLDKLKDENKSLLLILDDINGLASSEQFANWLKSMVDEIATSNKAMQFCILIVGLEDRRSELIAKQPSLARVFEIIEINPWSDEETREFYKESFEKSGAIITNEQLSDLVRFTGGLPVLAHEIGDAVWRRAKTHEIDKVDLVNGIFEAAEVIGKKLLEPQVLSAIRSEKYRSILRKIAHEPFQMQFQRAELVSKLTTEEVKVLDNFLQRMKGLGAITTDSEARGGYQFFNRLHSLYFWLEAQRAKNEKE